MRGIPPHLFLIIFIFLLAIDIITFLGLFQSFKKNRKKIKIVFSILYWAVSCYTWGAFLFLFSNPELLRETTNYTYFNNILILTFLNLLPKLTLSVFTLLRWLISVFNSNIARIFYLSGLILSLGIILIVGYSVTIGKQDIREVHVSLPIKSLPPELDGITIMQLSDIHLGSFNKSHAVLNKALAIALRNKPDIIVFTGDIVNNFSTETEGYINQLEKLKAPFGKIAIQGNHDYGDYYQWKSSSERDQNLEQIRQAVRDMGFSLLLNSNQRIAIKDTALYFIGVQNWGHKPFPQYANLNKAMQGIPAHCFKILLSHDPAHWDAQVVPETNIPLTLSGHTHGLQSGIRIAGIEFSLMYLLEKHWGGLYSQGAQYLYVNRGLGTVGFAGRVEMRPEITFITLHSN